MEDGFEGEKTQCSVLGYKTDPYFQEYKLAIEVDELGHNDSNIDYETQRQRATKKELGCVLIRVYLHQKNFHIFKAMNKIHRDIKKSTRKSTFKNTVRTRI